MPSIKQRSIPEDLKHDCWVCGETGHSNPYAVNKEGKQLCKLLDKWKLKTSKSLFEQYKNNKQKFFNTPIGKKWLEASKKFKLQRRKTKKSVKSSIKETPTKVGRARRSRRSKTNKIKRSRSRTRRSSRSRRTSRSRRNKTNKTKRSRSRSRRSSRRR